MGRQSRDRYLMERRPAVLLGSVLAGIATLTGAQQGGPGPAWGSQDWQIFEHKVRWGVEQGLDTLPIGSAIVRIGLSFVGTPYAPATLDVPGPERLVVNFREFDCVTFLENVIALARFIRRDGAGALADPERARARYESYLTQLRYRAGAVEGYASRLHYFSDWLNDNESRGVLRQVTRELGGIPDSAPVTFMSSHPAAYWQLEDPTVRAAIQEVEARVNAVAPRWYLPEDRVDLAAGQIRDGDLIAATSTVPGLDVVHTGIAVWQGGRLYLLHAPLNGGSVEVSAQPLAERIRSQPKQDGIMVARVLD